MTKVFIRHSDLIARAFHPAQLDMTMRTLNVNRQNICELDPSDDVKGGGPKTDKGDKPKGGK